MIRILYIICIYIYRALGLSSFQAHSLTLALKNVYPLARRGTAGTDLDLALRQALCLSLQMGRSRQWTTGRQTKKIAS